MYLRYKYFRYNIRSHPQSIDETNCSEFHFMKSFLGVRFLTSFFYTNFFYTNFFVFFTPIFLFFLHQFFVFLHHFFVFLHQFFVFFKIILDKSITTFMKKFYVSKKIWKEIILGNQFYKIIDIDVVFWVGPKCSSQ